MVNAAAWTSANLPVPNVECRTDRMVGRTSGAAERADLTLADRIGILIWELDRRSEAESLLAEFNTIATDDEALID